MKQLGVHKMCQTYIIRFHGLHLRRTILQPFLKLNLLKDRMDDLYWEFREWWEMPGCTHRSAA